MRRVGLVLKRDKPEAVTIAQELGRWLAERGHTLVMTPLHADAVPGASVVADVELATAVDLLVVLGGDGTLLHGAGLLGARPVPVSPADARDALARACDGTLATENRMRLRMTLHHDGETVDRLALNDVVIAQGAMARLVDLEATIDGRRLTQFRADGLILIASSPDANASTRDTHSTPKPAVTC